MLLTSLTSFLAATLALTAIGIDIALYVCVRHEMAKLVGVVESTGSGPGACFLSLWLWFSEFPILRPEPILPLSC